MLHQRCVLSVFVLLAAVAAGCNDGAFDLPDTALAELQQGPVAALTTGDWTSGALPGTIVAPSLLKPLGGARGGVAFWKSNNPEVIRGNGWLMQNSRTDATRGGGAYALSGTSNVYLFHINKSGSTRYLHVLVTNPQASNITVSGKGSVYTNAEKPLNGAGTGQSYAVALDWLRGSYRTTFGGVALQPYKAYQVYRATLSNNNMVDGRFEITASAGAYVYTVVTSSGSLTDAINATQGGPAAGDIAQPGTNAYGREAGVYSNTIWAGVTNIDVPAAPAHMGVALNTSDKFAVNGVFLQDQTSASLVKLSDSAPRTYGNYGHKYDVTLALRNPSGTARTVRLSLASNFTSTTNSPSFTFNGPITLNGTEKTIYTTPTAPKQWLATWTVPANSTFNGRVTFFVPGLITIGQQFILESL